MCVVVLVMLFKMTMCMTTVSCLYVCVSGSLVLRLNNALYTTVCAAAAVYT